jgi:hypothetical protein
MKKMLIPSFLLIAWVAQATMVKPMTVEDLTSAASTVVEGQATESWTSWNALHTRIYTFTRVQVSRALKGSPGETVVVKQLGGSADGYTQHVSGVRPIQTGEAALLFLRPSEAHDGTMVVVGLMQGQFRLARDSQSGATVVSNGVLGAEEMQSSSTKVQPYHGSALTLSQMEARVQKAVGHE